ncbi:pathway-specific nitrogen regulator [Cryptococcus deuterogattii LA55]|nr:pathway-specific nitrogen regulator [Cryptococcus deuterogattii LA55]KIR95227.1 pathway-specific nitrogen regulator [Cryptococcus deuterogattii CBS 10090]
MSEPTKPTNYNPHEKRRTTPDSSGLVDSKSLSNPVNAGPSNSNNENNNPESDNNKRRRSSPSSEPPRVQLACFYCRTKRVRCSGTKPRCEGCIKADVECEWPAARAKKRTKKEMEEARRAESERNAITAAAVSTSKSNGPSVYKEHVPVFNNDQLQQPDLLNNQSHFWSNPVTSTQYLWPPDLSTLPNIESSSDGANQPASNTSQIHQTTSSGQLSIDPNSTAADVQRTSGGEMVPSASISMSNDGNPASGQEFQFLTGNEWSPNTDWKIASALEGQPAFISGNPEEGDDLELFYYRFHMSQHFPSCSHQRMMERFQTGTMSQFLACCICSLGARFSDVEDRARAAAPFIARAQELVPPLLHLPTHDVLTGLLFLAWSNYGQNSESGLWQYSGMAIRMSSDLGAHEVSELYESPAHYARNQLCFWSLFITDRVVAFATGRPASIPEDIIEIPLPKDEDFFPDPARNLPDSPFEPVEPVPFVQLVKLMVIVGRISNVLNGRRGRALTLISTSEPLPELLAELQLRLVTFYANLPDSLKWSANNFKHQHARGHSGTFLTLHLWANAVLALIYHPELLKSPSGVETPLNRSMSRNVQLSLASSRQIVECMVFADLVDSTSYTSSPYLAQPLFVAAHSSNATDMLMLSMAKQNFSTILNAVHKMEEYWAGVNYVATLLEKPPLWLSDFMSGYTVENMSFAPADNVDLERLLATRGERQDGSKHDTNVPPL